MSALQYVLRIVLWAVAIMSGSLAILRESLAIFAPGRVQQRSLFWSCVIVAYVISAAVLWYVEHKKAVGNKPKLHAEYSLFTAAPGGANNEDSIITVRALITNTGAPSIVQHIRIGFRIDEKLHWGEPLPWPQDGKITLHFDAGSSLVIKKEDDLYKKCLTQPIATGGAASGVCFMRFIGVRPDKIKHGTRMVFEFQDVLKKKYSFDQETETGRKIPPDLNKLQSADSEPSNIA